MKTPAVIQTKLKPRTTYPWEAWTADSKTRRYVKGEHFEMSPRNFAIMCHTYARRHGLVAITKVSSKTTVDVQFSKADRKKAS